MITNVTVFFSFVCASTITSCADVEQRAGWCNMEQTCLLCQMWFCSAKSGLTGTPVKHTHKHERPASKPSPRMKITPEQSTYRFTGCYVRRKPLHVSLCVCVCARFFVKFKATSSGGSWSSEWSPYGSISPVNGLYLSSRVLFFLSVCLSITSSLLPLYFMATAVAGLDLEEIKNLCCSSLSPENGRMSIKCCIMCCHIHTRRKSILYWDKNWHPHILEAISLLKVTNKHTDSKPEKDTVCSLTWRPLRGVYACYHPSGIDGASNTMKTNIDVLFVLTYVLVAEPVTGKASSWPVLPPPCHGHTLRCLDT